MTAIIYHNIPYFYTNKSAMQKPAALHSYLSTIQPMAVISNIYDYYTAVGGRIICYAAFGICGYKQVSGYANIRL